MQLAPPCAWFREFHNVEQVALSVRPSAAAWYDTNLRCRGVARVRGPHEVLVLLLMACASSGETAELGVHSSLQLRVGLNEEL